jgi:hypothetical protein
MRFSFHNNGGYNMKKMIIIFLILCICTCLTFPVFAEASQRSQNEHDWANTDWEAFAQQDHEDNVWEALADWLKTEADMDTVLLVTTTTGDGWVGELWAGVVSHRFLQDPYEFLQALAKQDSAVIEDVATQIGYLVFFSEEDVKTFFSNLTLPKNMTAKETDALNLIVTATEESWELELAIPKTGDPVDGILAVMLSSGLVCGAMLLNKRKNY